MNGILINIKEHKTNNEFEMVKTIVKLIMVTKNISLSETEVFALTYLVIKGFNTITREELVDNKLFKTRSAVANLISKFRKYGIVIRTTKGEELISDFDFFQKDLDAVKFQIVVRK